VTRDRIIVGVILVLVAIAVIARHIITGANLLIFAVAIPSIILHEVSHGVAALAFGDDTAKKAGRLTLNPIPHIDLLGTLILPALLAVSGLAVFGYAKPVPVNPNKMRHPANDAVWTSLTGPATNLIFALAAAAWLHIEKPRYLSLTSGPFSMRIPLAFGFINVVLTVFNLVPIPPLDGSAVVGRFLPQKWLPTWYQIRRYGVIVLLLLVLVKPSWINDVLFPFENWWASLFGGRLTR
jgi:Zn-dependent protease